MRRACRHPPDPTGKFRNEFIDTYVPNGA